MSHLLNISNHGFAIENNIYTEKEIKEIISAIETVDQSKKSFRKSTDLFAIRKFLNEIPAVKSLIFNRKMKALITEVFGDGYFIVKSIYFDKPEQSNWFVSRHQDLTIAVDKKIDIEGFGSWTKKIDSFAVQPPVDILQDNFTIRIHLDDTDDKNGALKVIPGSHLKNIHLAEQVNIEEERDVVCNVKAGGAMIMRPLLMHSSERSTSNKGRRVIHIEFSRKELPVEINWAEKEAY